MEVTVSETFGVTSIVVPACTWPVAETEETIVPSVASSTTYFVTAVRRIRSRYTNNTRRPQTTITTMPVIILCARIFFMKLPNMFMKI